MKNAKQWLEERCFSLKGVNETTIVEIQIDVVKSLIRVSCTIGRGDRSSVLSFLELELLKLEKQIKDLE